MAAGAAESAEQGHSRYEEGCARIKDEEKSSLTISNFYATSDLFLHIPRRPEPVLHFSVGAPDAESQQPLAFRYQDTLWRGNDGTVTASIQKSAMVSP
jgi:hypothetical protein